MSENEKRNFCVGDLVVSLFPLELDLYQDTINVGDVGLIVNLMPYKESINGEYDYVVLIKGKEVFFFEDELEHYKEGAKNEFNI